MMYDLDYFRDFFSFFSQNMFHCCTKVNPKPVPYYVTDEEYSYDLFNSPVPPEGFEHLIPLWRAANTLKKGKRRSFELTYHENMFVNTIKSLLGNKVLIETSDDEQREALLKAVEALFETFRLFVNH